MYIYMSNDVLIAADEDYVDQSGQVLQFEAGDSRMCTLISILDDNLLESAECFFLDLVSNIDGIPISSTKVQINDDEGGKQLYIMYMCT